MSATDKPLSGHQILRTYVVDEGLTPAEAATKFLSHTDRSIVDELIHPTVTAMARQYERHETRKVEQQFPDAESLTTPQARTELYGKKVALPSGVYVPWGQMTAEQHRERAQWQRDQAGRIVADAVRHEKAAARIEEAGVTCLDEIDSEDAR